MKKIYTSTFCLFTSYFAFATNWLVGPTQTYTMPSQVSTLVANGDTVSIDAGTYTADVCKWTANNLLLRGVSGFAHLKSNGLSWGDKAIWVIGGDNTRVEWIEFSECTSTSLNGAGIRQEGKNLIVRYCYFHNNENGILAGTFNPSTILIEFTEFGYNGAGDGYSHNLYINGIDTLIFRYNYSHHCNIGHELKSRAKVNYILYNRFSNEATGNASREIDLPNGGMAIMMGNIIEQGPNSTNSGIIGYGLEGLNNPAPHELYLINNTLVNEKTVGSFVALQTGMNLFKGYNNIFAGGGSLMNGSAATIDTSNNWRVNTISSVGFVNSANYDYHLTSGSAAINGGANAGVANNGFSLTPMLEYEHPANSISRMVSGIIDIGAHEFVSPAGITESRNDFDITIFPNPSDGEFRIKNQEFRILHVEVYNSLGETIYSSQINSDKAVIDLNKQPKGIYCYQIKSEKEILKTGKIIIE